MAETTSKPSTTPGNAQSANAQSAPHTGANRPPRPPGEIGGHTVQPHEQTTTASQGLTGAGTTSRDTPAPADGTQSQGGGAGPTPTYGVSGSSPGGGSSSLGTPSRASPQPGSQAAPNQGQGAAQAGAGKSAGLRASEIGIVEGKSAAALENPKTGQAPNTGGNLAAARAHGDIQKPGAAAQTGNQAGNRASGQASAVPTAAAATATSTIPAGQRPSGTKEHFPPQGLQQEQLVEQISRRLAENFAKALHQSITEAVQDCLGQSPATAPREPSEAERADTAAKRSAAA